MTIVNCGIINTTFIIPILGGLIRAFFRVYLDLREENQVENINNIRKFHQFINGFYTELGMILSFIPYFILKCQSKKSVEPNSRNAANNRLTIRFEYYDLYERNRKNKYKWIFIAAIFDFSQTVLLYPFHSECPYNVWIFDICYLSFLSYFILNTKLYRHQHISMVIIILLGAGLNYIVYLKNEIKEIDILEIIFKIISEFSFCFNIVLSRYIMEKYFCSPYEICMWEGIINIILSIFGIFILFIIYYEDFNFWDTFLLNDPWLILAVLVVSVFYNIFLLVTSAKLSPCHVIITMIIHECYFYTKIDEDEYLNIIGFSILLLMFITFLLFIEIIELNICDISKNTKKNIKLRAIADNDSMSTSTDLDNDNDVEPEVTQSLSCLISNNTTKNEIF